MSEELTSEQIEELKSRYGPIFAITVGGTRFIFRTITRIEAAECGVFSDKPAIEVDDVVFNLALIHPRDDLDLLPAGTAHSAASKILEKSGLTSASGINAYYEAAKVRASNIYTDLNAIICAAFPTILPHELDELPIDRFMDLLVISHRILDVRGAAVNGLLEEVKIVSQDEVEESQNTGTPVGTTKNGLTEQEVLARLDQAARESGIADGSFHDRHFGYQGNFEMENLSKGD